MKRRHSRRRHDIPIEVVTLYHLLEVETQFAELESRRGTDHTRTYANGRAGSYLYVRTAMLDRWPGLALHALNLPPLEE